MSFEETVCIIYFNAFNFFKIYREMNQYTKQKQTHKHRKQTLTLTLRPTRTPQIGRAHV